MDGGDEHGMVVQRCSRITSTLEAIDALKPLLKKLIFVRVGNDRVVNNEEDFAKAILYYASKSCKHLESVEFKNDDEGEKWELSESGILQILEDVPTLQELVIHKSSSLHGQLFFPAQLQKLTCPITEDILEAITQSCNGLVSIAFTYVCSTQRPSNKEREKYRQIMQLELSEINRDYINGQEAGVKASIKAYQEYERKYYRGENKAQRVVDARDVFASFMEKFHTKLKSIQLESMPLSEKSMQLISKCKQLTYLNINGSDSSHFQFLDLSMMTKL